MCLVQVKVLFHSIFKAFSIVSLGFKVFHCSLDITIFFPSWQHWISVEAEFLNVLFLIFTAVAVQGIYFLLFCKWCKADKRALQNMADISQNSSFNQSSEYGNVYRPQTVFSVLTFTLLAMLVVATFVWNMLVLVTILRVRTFHRVPHNLVASMAISDVMVAALVMPLSLVHELNGRQWKLGRVLCQIWISFDVLCCTASIWNVTAIALDRYWSITRHLEYTLKTRKKISNVMIGLTWLLSSVISLSPLFGWGETYTEEDMECQVSQEPSYTIFSTFGAFYLPLCVVLFVYWKIYKAAKFRIGSKRTNTITPVAEAGEVQIICCVICFFSNF